MKINVSCDLEEAWNQATLPCRIFYFWLVFVGWFILVFGSFFTVGVTRLGMHTGLFINEQNETSNRSSTEVDKE